MTAEILVDLITGAIVPDTGEVTVFGQLDHRDRRSRAWLQTLDSSACSPSARCSSSSSRSSRTWRFRYSLAVERSVRRSPRTCRRARRRRSASHRRISSSRAACLRRSAGCVCASAAHWRCDPKVLLAEHPNATLAAGRSGTSPPISSASSTARGIAALVLTADQEFARAARTKCWCSNPATGTLKSSSGWRRWFS